MQLDELTVSSFSKKCAGIHLVTFSCRLQEVFVLHRKSQVPFKSNGVFWRLYMARARAYFQNQTGSFLMPDANLIAPGKVSVSSIQNKHAKRSNLRLQLRNEIDKLALSIRELKAQADSVQKAADALGDELLFDSVDTPLEFRLSRRDGHLVK